MDKHPNPTKEPDWEGKKCYLCELHMELAMTFTKESLALPNKEGSAHEYGFKFFTLQGKELAL